MTVTLFREALYQGGGVLFVTSRILVVDLLKNQCPADKVTGVLVFNAHRYKCKFHAMKLLVVNLSLCFTLWYHNYSCCNLE